MMGRPKHPCARQCPRRSVGCHNKDYCPDWGKYEEAMARFRVSESKRKQAEADCKGTNRASVRLYLRRSGKKEVQEF